MFRVTSKFSNFRLRRKCTLLTMTPLASNNTSPKATPNTRSMAKGFQAVDVTSAAAQDVNSSRTSSPTAVTDDRLLLQNSDKDAEILEETSYLPIIPADIQKHAIYTYYHVHDFVQEKQKNFVLDRKAITTMILSFLASVLGFLGVVAASIGGVAVVSLPIWLPIALLTLPLWLPFMLFTSPVWVTATATIIGCVLTTCGFVLAVAFFFAWPEDWLPSKESSEIVGWYLKQRDAATMALAKLQAKFLLYAAGVGPAADAVFIVMDKVDFQALVNKLQRVDWKDLGQKAQNGELSEIQKILFEIAGSLIQ